MKFYQKLLSVPFAYGVDNIHESSKFQQNNKRISAMQVLWINTGKIDYRGE